MFWSKLASAIPFLFQVIVVIALVIVFAFFDPLGLLVSTKLKLKDTPVDVRSIKDIGQLITAEYYGEVVQSYAYKVKEENRIQVEELEGGLLDIHRQFVSTIDVLKEDFNSRKLRRKDIMDEYRRLMGSYLTEEDYPLYIYYVNRKVDDKNYKIRHLDNEIRDSQEKTLVSKLVREKKYDSPPTKDRTYISDLLSVYTADLNKSEKKQLKKSNLVMLGRGWVKAGFDFGKFSEDNFRYNEDSKSIYFIGLNPQILSATINPWFIPEKGVEGFEFLIVERKVRRDYKVVQEVKQMCLDELKRKAFERDILKKSIENAKSTMKEFFSLLLDEPVEQVTFYENELEFSMQEILRNDTISGEELLLIDRLLRKDSLIGIKKDELWDKRKIFLDTIKARLFQMDEVKGRVPGRTKIYPFVYNDSLTTSFEPEYAMLYAVTKDRIFTEEADLMTIGRYADYYCTDSNSGGVKNWKTKCLTSFDPEIKERAEMLVISAKTIENMSDKINYHYSLVDSLGWTPSFNSDRGELQAIVDLSNNTEVIWIEEIKGSNGKPVAYQIEMDTSQNLFDLFITNDKKDKHCQCQN